MHFCENKTIFCRFYRILSLPCCLLVVISLFFIFYFFILCVGGLKNANEMLLVHGLMPPEPFFKMHRVATGRLLAEQDIDT